MDPQADASTVPDRRPPGRPPAYIDERGRIELLGLIAAGKGVDLALRKLGIPYRRYQNTCRKRPRFVDEVASARRAASQELDETGYLMAMSGVEHKDILVEMWARRDRARNLMAARKEKALDRALTLHLAEMKAKADAERDAASATPDASTPDFTRLSVEELATYRAIGAKLRGPANVGPIA